MKRKLKITFILLGLLFSSVNAFSAGLKFKTTDIKNKNVTDSIFADSKLTMINVWGTFCGPCIAEMPDLGKLSKAYKKKDFQLVGIVIDGVNRRGTADPKMVEAANQIVNQTGADYLHIIPSPELMNGVLSNIYAVPTTFFVDKNGNIVGKAYTGSRPMAAWKAIVDDLLKEIK